jgi:hypothetical protein
MDLSPIYRHLILNTVCEAASLYNIPAATICAWIDRDRIGYKYEQRGGKMVRVVSRLEFQLFLYTAGAGIHQRQPQCVSLNEIVTTGSLPQMRVRTSLATARDYAGKMQLGEEFPEIECVRLNGKLEPTDGRHRILANRLLEHGTIPARIVEHCSMAEALVLAASANGKTGLRLTFADRRKKAEILILSPECANLSTRELGKLTGYCAMQIKRIRDELLGETKGGMKSISGAKPEVGTEAWIVARIRSHAKQLAKTQPAAAAQIESAMDSLIKPPEQAAEPKDDGAPLAA